MVSPNSFLEDTCVLVALAFVFVRGPVERMLTTPVHFGALVGALGASEALFPSSRFPYAPHTLAVAVASAYGGFGAGSVSILLISAISLVLLPISPFTVMLSQTLIVLVTVCAVKRWRDDPKWLFASAVSGFAGGIVFNSIFIHEPQESLSSFLTVPANAFAFVLLGLVVRDALIRSESQKLERDFQEAKRLAAESNLAALRSRIQPHFLFNALNSIAALCHIDPPEASKATVRLGSLMRRCLEADALAGITIREELETVGHYLAIEQKRYGAKLKVRYETDGCEEALVPTFSIQTLVENAVLHGVSCKAQGGEVAIISRNHKKRLLVAIIDDGVGVKLGLKPADLHGLGILTQQIKGKYGSDGKFHLIRRAGGGTIAAFAIPFETKSK